MRLLLPCLTLILCACAPNAARAPASARLPPSAGIDYSCRVDADCAVKDIGSCCGRYPTCVNHDSATYPERVRAECAKKHGAGICGFPEVTACSCVEHRCANIVAGENATQ